MFRSLLQSDDPFIFLKTIFIDGCYNIVIKNISYICLVLHTSSYMLDIIYLIQHFTLNVLLKYGCGFAIMTYVSIFVKKISKKLAVHSQDASCSFKVKQSIKSAFFS